LLKQSSKQDPKLDLRPSKSHRVEKSNVKSTEAGTKQKAPTKGLHMKLGDVASRLPKSDDLALKQRGPAQASVEFQQFSQKANFEGKTGTEVKKLLDIPPVQQQKKIVSLLDIKIPSRYRQPVGETSHGKKVVPEPVYQKETVEVDQRHVANNSEQRNSKVEMDKTVMASKNVDEITPQTCPVVIPLMHVEEKVEEPPAVSATSPVPEHVVEKPSTTEVELVTNEEPEMQPPVSYECHEADSSKPESVQQEQTAHQIVTTKKTEVSMKNVAQVKPLLVASVPEKSKWERDTDISDNRDLPIYAAKDRARPTAFKTSLPR